jgi:acyl-coenzyme A synthetase/AMP-(fatty) acid ligase
VPGPNTEAVIVVAETREDVDRRPALKRQIHQRLRDGVGVMLSEVLLIDAGLLPKTSSGKLQRQKTKQMYLSGQFAVPAPRHAPQADAQSAGGLTVK